MTNYSDLINYKGGIYNKNTQSSYADPMALAKDMGLAAMPENWHLNPEIQTVSSLPFTASVPDNITTKDASNAVTAPPLPTDIQNGINGPTVNPEATGVISDMAGSNTSNFQGRLDNSATYNSLSTESSATMAALRQVLSQPSPVLDETQAKEQQKALADAQGIYKDKLKELNDEELRIKQQWGVGPIWRGRLNLFNSEKALMLEPLQVQVEFLSGQYDKALDRAQKMFENAVSLQQNKISKLSALNDMITGQLSREEENMWKQYQIDEENRLATLKREQDLQDQKVELAMKGYVFDPTSTMDEIMKVVGPQAQKDLGLERQLKRKQLSDSGTDNSAPSSLKDLAKLGYTRKMSKGGIGWDFFKSGKPVTAQQISQNTGVSLDTLLEGSNNPEDIKTIQSLNPSASGSWFNSL